MVIEHPYLKRKIENLDSKKNIPAYFHEQVAPYSYKERGSFRHIFRDTQLELIYKSIHNNGELQEKYIHVYEKIKKAVSKVVPRDNLDLLLFKSLRIVEKFSLKKEEALYDLQNILPDDYIVAFLADWEIVHKKSISFMNPIDKFVFIGEDILNPEGLLSLCHEVGHLQDFSQMNQQEFINTLNENRFFFFAPDDLIQSIPVEHREHLSASVLKRERDAWYFGLSGLRPFLKDLDIDNLIINIRQSK